MTPLTLTAERDGERIDQFFAQACPGLTRSAAQKLIEDGAALLDGKPVKKNRKTTAGEVYTLLLPDPEPMDAAPQDIPLDIRYEDEMLLVVNKPRGMVVHPAPGNPDGTLVNALLYHCRGSLSGINGVIRPGIVHRIDKNTSGLLIVAKTDEAHLCLAEQIRAHSFTREYRAVVYVRSLLELVITAFLPHSGLFMYISGQMLVSLMPKESSLS